MTSSTWISAVPFTTGGTNPITTTHPKLYQLKKRESSGGYYSSFSMCQLEGEFSFEKVESDTGMPLYRIFFQNTNTKQIIHPSSSSPLEWELRAASTAMNEESTWVIHHLAVPLSVCVCPPDELEFPTFVLGQKKRRRRSKEGKTPVPTAIIHEASTDGNVEENEVVVPPPSQKNSLEKMFWSAVGKRRKIFDENRLV